MAGLLDLLQSASNSAASNVSAPVDALAWLLKKAGVPVGEPVGGSDWMQRQGLTRPVKQSPASLAGETIGLLSPVVAAAKAPQIARGLLQAGDNLAAPATLNPQTGAVVWHGSPHKFDAFDSSRIGTGEGAQAYGHGLYLAENPGVAGGYADRLSQVPLDSGGYDKVARFATYGKTMPRRVDLNAPSNTLTPAELALTYVNMNGGSKFEAGEALRDMASSGVSDADKYKKALAALDRLSTKKIGAEVGGNIYKVDLPDEKIARMLDWDKPLSQQAPEVQSVVAKFKTANIPPEGLDMGGGGRIISNAGRKVKPESSSPWVLKSGNSLFDISQKDVERMLMSDKGEAAYTRMTAMLGGQDKATEALRQAGVPGIRYLDGGSRGAGSGSSNFVVFPGEESALRILERNGQGLLGP